ncbi:MAG: hypothetical protein ACYCRD_03050 [Leptospirillum sp.]
MWGVKPVFMDRLYVLDQAMRGKKKNRNVGEGAIAGMKPGGWL